MHDIGLVITLAAALATAFVLGFVAQSIRVSPIVGYLLAGIAIGPRTPGFVADGGVAAQLAEVGVVLLMFGVGLHFDVRDLVRVRGIAIPGAVGQSLGATALGVALAAWFGWGIGAGIAFGVGLSVASTVVLIRVLEGARRLDTPEGHAAVGWLVVEDIFTVLFLVLLPALAGAAGGAGPVAAALGLAVAKVVVLGALVLVVGARAIPWMLSLVARTRSGELFTLAILAVALVVATGAALLFGVSMALGAFLAGMVVGRSGVSHQAAADALPMRDAFAVLFFVSVGMLFDPALLVERPGLVLGSLAIVLVGKPLAALAIVALLGHSVRTALTVALGLAQIGEFSFILAGLARSLGVLPEEGQSLLVATALISIAVNPALFRMAGPLEAWLRGRPRLWATLNRRAERKARALSARTAESVAEEGVRAVVVGYGPVGRTVTRILKEFDVRAVVIDLNVDTVSGLEAGGHAAIYGDAGRAEILRAAGVGDARFILVTLPDLHARVAVIRCARAINPSIRILVRAHYLGERPVLEEAGASIVCYEEAEAAVALARSLLGEFGADETRIRAEIARVRAELRPGGTPRIG
ncbi:MAG TPA: cation:proton antiporter [Planctomycetota bacterium]|nr:cation:proton antiporter [Planctomycetota bacterium]